MPYNLKQDWKANGTNMSYQVTLTLNSSPLPLIISKFPNRHNHGALRGAALRGGDLMCHMVFSQRRTARQPHRRSGGVMAFWHFGDPNRDDPWADRNGVGFQPNSGRSGNSLTATPDGRVSATREPLDRKKPVAVS